MVGGVVIRDVTVADLPALRAMLVATWHATYDPIYGVDRVAAITDRWHALDQLRAGLGPQRIALVAVADGTIVGHAYVTVADDAATLWRLYVQPHVQRRGIGARLVTAAFAAAPAHTRQRLEVEPANGAAIAFYRRMGFIDIGYAGASTDMPAAVRMARDV